MRAVRLHIAGKVQGVGYRAWAMRIAADLGLRGWVRNLANGTVELLATGDDDAVAAMIEACRHGPSGARVDSIDKFEAEDDGSLGFTGRETA
jgi:acylphosphatase